MAESQLAVTSLTPLQHRKVALAGGELRELPQTLKFSLRGDAGDQKFLQSASSALSNAGVGELVIPATPNTVSAGHDGSIFWMAPDEWLVRSEPAAFNTLSSKLSEEAFAAEFADQHVAVVDVSDYYTVFELESMRAVELLARGCPLDLESCFAKVGCCAQTRIGNAAVLLDSNAADLWRIQVRWSYAQYLWQLLERSALSL